MNERNQELFCWRMARRHGIRISHFAGTVLGLLFGVLLSSWCRQRLNCSPMAGPCCTVHVNYHVDIAVEHIQIQNGQFIENGNSNINHELEIPKSQGLDLSTYIDKEEKGFLLIGVITAKKFLDTRAVAAFQTWAQTCVGTCKVLFFSSEGSTTNNKIPIVSLDGIDDVYPPQRKSLSMIKYMHDNYINNFEWFMRADDDVFIKGDRVEKFLRSLNSSKPQFIGQAGKGKKDEIGKLHLSEQDNFCMGGPGIVFSHETLRQMSPHIGSCLHNLMTSHEDVEVGRCIKNYVGIACTWAFEMQQLFYQNYKEEIGSFQTTLKDKAVRVALTLHSVKDPKHQYRIANYLRSLHIEDLHQKELSLQREITFVDRMTGLQKSNTLVNKQGLAPSVLKYSPKSADEILSWEFISKSVVSHRDSNPRHGLTLPIKSTMEDVIIQMMQMVNKNACRKGRTIDFKSLWYGYHRVSPLYGADYVLDLLLTYRKHKGRKMTVPVRRHAYIQQVFGSIESIEDPFTVRKHSYELDFESPFLYKGLGAGSAYEMLPSKNKLTETIHFILPLSGRLPIFMRFLDNYEKTCLLNKENCQLHVVLFNKDMENSDVDDLVNLVGKYQKQYGGSSVELTFADGPFARAKALDMGAAQCGSDSLLFFVDVDIKFSHEALLRIRLNTKKGVQVYYPIVFSQFDPVLICNQTHPSCEVNWRDFSSEMGYWRSFGYGIVSLYGSDLSTVGGFNTSIQGWGKEDVDLYSKFCDSNITVFRTIDPHLVHAFHPIICDTKLEEAQYQMCLGSRASSFASVNKLANIVYNQPRILNRNQPTNGRS
ncbi:chondroitin sulfate synthase 1-like [Argopecten irradians]|uniref:chondroitin sulfate synthase 1-like n=1 Tax=Argopecten irradians TaxID=31199 RepID=UPI0037112F7D